MNNNLAKFSRYALIPLFAVLTACGGGGGTETTTTTATPATPTLVSIAVTPANATVAVGATQQYTATGTTSDGKTAALKTGVTWSTTGNFASIVAATGIATGTALGVETVTATSGTVSGSTSLTVRGPWAAISAGSTHTLARRSDGTLYAWGFNQNGQLGDGTTVAKTTPTLINSTASTAWTQIASGEFHNLGLRADGTLWAWGLNQNGQLGDGSTTNRAIPVKVGKDTNWLFVAAGKSHSLAIKTDGTLW
ncbi:MAG TPA: Ig-like domain-containing protein, partial [Janthinobacterium sp.]|nr:Ig-like domain-containing protein [Janthinobacterium sp.]